MGGIELLEREEIYTYDIPVNEYIVHYIKNNKDLMLGIRRGVSDLKNGKVRPWSEIKKELHF